MCGINCLDNRTCANAMKTISITWAADLHWLIKSLTHYYFHNKKGLRKGDQWWVLSQHYPRCFSSSSLTDNNQLCRRTKRCAATHQLANNTDLTLQYFCHKIKKLSCLGDNGTGPLCVLGKLIIYLGIKNRVQNN